MKINEIKKALKKQGLTIKKSIITVNGVELYTVYENGIKVGQDTLAGIVHTHFGWVE